MAQSILTSKTAEAILKVTKKHLQRDRRLDPMLFLITEAGEQLATMLELPDTSQERRDYLRNMGLALWRKGKLIEEALMVAQTWFVHLGGQWNNPTVAPSQHPQRKEAIFLVGRDASKRRSLFILQPFTRGRRNEPVWEKPEGTFYGEPSEQETSFEGMLDYLFVRERAKQVA